MFLNPVKTKYDIMSETKSALGEVKCLRASYADSFTRGSIICNQGHFLQILHTTGIVCISDFLSLVSGKNFEDTTDEMTKDGFSFAVCHVLY